MRLMAFVAGPFAYRSVGQLGHGNDVLRIVALGAGQIDPACNHEVVATGTVRIVALGAAPLEIGVVHDRRATRDGRQIIMAGRA